MYILLAASALSQSWHDHCFCVGVAARLVYGHICGVFASTAVDSKLTSEAAE